MRRVVTLLSILGLIAGCDSVAAPPAQLAALSQSNNAQQSAQKDVYVGQSDGGGKSIVFEFGAQNDQNRAPKCSIVGLRNVIGIGSDSAGNVYIPGGATNTIRVYAPLCGRIIAKIHDGFGAPMGAIPIANTICAPSTTGVAVCNFSGCTSNLTDASIFQITSAGVDSSGNVWAANYDRRDAIALVVWPRGAMPGRVVSGYAGTLSPGDIQFDKHDVLISVASPFATVSTFDCKIGPATCLKTGSFPLRNASNFGALNAANTDFQVADLRLDAVDVYAYPGFAYEYSYDRGFRQGSSPVGITQIPAVSNHL